MRKLLLILFFFCNLILVSFGASEARQEIKIKISYFNVPPFIIYDDANGRLTGGAIHEFLEDHIGPKMGVEFVWDRSPSSIPRQLFSLDTGSTDALALLSFTPQRAQKMVFTATPYFISSPGLATLKRNRLEKVATIEDILSLRIGYGQNIHITPFMRDKRIDFDLVASANFNEQNFRKLMASRIDAVYAPDLASLLAVVRKLELEEKVKLIRLPDAGNANHVVFGKHMKDVCIRYNEAFEQLQGKQLFLEILEKYIDFSMLR